MVDYGGDCHWVTVCVYTYRRGHTDLQMMDIGATTPTNQIAWRQVAEQKYQRLMDNLQVEEQRQRVEQLDSTLYISKNNKVQMERARQESLINFLV